MVVVTLSLVQKGQTRGCSVQWTQWNSDIWWWGHCSLGQKGQTSGFSGCSHTVDTVHCVTVSSGLTFLHQGQCPHHHISLFYCTVYCVHCILWFDLFVSKTMSPPPYTTTTSTAYCVHCVHCIHCVLCPLCDCIH